MKDSIVIRITGDSGDGVQLVGEQLTITAALAGHDVRTLPDFPAEIRALAGTVAGVSGFQLAMAEQIIFTAGESLDVLVALNPAAIKSALQFLNHGGLLIVNEDSLSKKDWEKDGLDASYLDDVSEQYQIIKIPLITNTLATQEGLELSLTQAKKAKNFYVLGLVLWLFDLKPDHCIDFIHKKFKSDVALQQANELALKAGYNFALTIELSRQEYMLGHVEREIGEYRQITGVESIALAAATIATETQSPLLVAGYPITPASAILHECAKLEAFGVELLQAEDEIAAICAWIGASFGGSLVFACTAGPGLDVKSESLGLAVITELPLVVIDVQRAGASTGLPTKTEQADLNQALYGRHGDAPLPVFAPITPADCFHTLIMAFTIATKYMTPVIILMDAYLANAAEPWKIPDIDSLELPDLCYNQSTEPYQRNEWLGRSWNKPGSKGYIHQIGGLEKDSKTGKVSYDPANHAEMVALRAAKIAGIAREYESIIIEGNEKADTLVIGWGSTYGSLKSAVNECNQEGVAVAHLQLRHLNPMPNDLEQYLKQYKHVLVAELNTGQLCQLIRSTYLIDAQPIAQSSGLPFSTSYLVDRIKEVVLNGGCHD
jgi:2-oxoglutarate ferredoxin oxidoreductase subunit alpha